MIVSYKSNAISPILNSYAWMYQKNLLYLYSNIFLNCFVLMNDILISVRNYVTQAENLSGVKCTSWTKQEHLPIWIELWTKRI